MKNIDGKGSAVEFSTLVEMFDRLAEKFGSDERPALMYKSNGAYKGISYTELRVMVDRFAAGLYALGVRRGDRIAVISENRPEWIVADLGMMRLGAVNVSLYPSMAPNQVEYILNDSGATIAIVSNDRHLRKLLGIAGSLPDLRSIILFPAKEASSDPRVISYTALLALGTEAIEASRSGREDVSEGDLLTLIYTSGTTGTPKGVMLTHRNLASNIKSSARCIPFTHDDRVLSFLPLSHSYERMAGYYTALACGVTIAFAESPDTLKENFIEAQPTAVMMVPRVFERIYVRLQREAAGRPVPARALFRWSIDAGKRYAALSKRGSIPLYARASRSIANVLVLRKIRGLLGGHIRFLASGGARLDPAIAEFFEAVGVVIIEGYGMTESSPVVSFNRLDEFEFGTVGKPIPGVEVAIASDGEVLVRGPNVMKGYWKDPASTSQIIDADGWLHTGDIGAINDRGYLCITDRKKHLFVTSGGKNIAPQPIENLFLQSDLIDQFVLIGDGRMFLSALIVPHFDRIREHAKRLNLRFTRPQELIENEQIRSLFEEEIASRQKNLANYERVRKFTLLPRPLTIENGEITPTLKVRRKIVEGRFKDEIDRMYDSFL